MGVNSLPKTVTRQRRGCALNPGPFAAESSTLTTRLPSYPQRRLRAQNVVNSALLKSVAGVAAILFKTYFWRYSMTVFFQTQSASQQFRSIFRHIVQK